MVSPANQRAAVADAFDRLCDRLDPDEVERRAIDRTKVELLEELGVSRGVDDERGVRPTKAETSADGRRPAGEAASDGRRPAGEAASDGRRPAGEAASDGRRPDGGTAARSAGGTRDVFPLGFRAILDRIGTTLFVLDTDGDIVHWNEAATKLTGVTGEEAKEVEMASEAFYHDGRRAKTLADKVLEAPESADDVYDVPRVDDYEFTLYRDRSTMTNAQGEEVHISFSAAPLYRGEELVGVVEMVQDRTDEVRRRERTAELVDELKTTLEAIQRGEYDARAEFEDRGLVDDRLLPVVEELNDLAAEFESLATHVTDQAAELHAGTEAVASTSGEISDLANDQRETMGTLAEEVADLSATIEEIAATAGEADDTSDRAATLASEGRAAATDAIEELNSVTDEVEAVADEVDRLQGRIDEISEAVEVIDSIAEETNILALNAAIEAARTDEGDGFAVVADEVKRLAGDSQSHAAEIEALVEEIQADAAGTVENVRTATEDVAAVTETVEDALGDLEGIAESTESTANSIREVADATDEQAESTEALAEMIDRAREKTERIADDVDSIADANEEQREKADALTTAIEEHTF